MCAGRRERHQAMVVANDLGLLLGDPGEADLDVADVGVPARARRHRVSGLAALGATRAETAGWLGVGAARLPKTSSVPSIGHSLPSLPSCLMIVSVMVTAEEYVGT